MAGVFDNIMYWAHLTDVVSSEQPRASQFSCIDIDKSADLQ